MTSATVDRMPRRKKDEPSRQPSAAIKVDADLAQKLRVISSVLNQDISDIVSKQLRPYVEKLYLQVVQQLSKEVQGGKS
jgi:hypothetical protein